ncbi:hypothetical protein OG233_02350 [Streptomyces sp. NBC_01218]|uniref:hypothetical protein n=1 Tax=Streptomyces sp. NBC_01218 TaxID=2903780 RepID=UPI002E0D34F5|nr:hypothetical protein OG233_02350 [Streptomyces sp. NBC_01218]
MIAVVGHKDLSGSTLHLVESELRARLERLTESTTACVRAGAGLPLAFGRAARDTGRKLTVLLPAQGSVPAVLPEPDRRAAAELLVLAAQVRLLAFDPGNRDACVGADENLVSESRTVLAVWDGSLSNGSDATAHLVAFARTRGIPVEVVWPDGASRGSA